MSTRTFMLTVTGFALIVAACSSYDATKVYDVGQTRSPVASVSLTVPLSLVTGQTARATATPKDANGAALTDRPVLWYTSSASIASVTDSGLVSAVAPGTAVVSAVSEGVSGQAALIVSAPAPIPVASVSVSPPTSTLQVGGAAQLSAVTRDANNNVLTGRVISWGSGNTGIATVSGSGLVTAVAAGSASITASSEGQAASAAISVSAPAPAPVASVSVSPATPSLQVGGTVQLSAVTSDASNNVLTGRVISWNSSSSAVATVSTSGLVTAVAAGNAQITATSEGQIGSATLTVASPPLPPATRPGSVSNLSVSAIESTSVTLSFTQIDDGAGHAASYDVRYAVAPISWGSAASTTSGTCTTPVAGSAIGSKITCTVLGLSPSTSYNFQLVAFRGTLNVNAVFGALSNIASASTTAQAAPPPPPPPSPLPSPPPGASNEPAGMTAITDRPFNALNESGWSDIFDVNMAFISDPAAPHSAPGILRATFPPGNAYDGSGPGSSDFTTGNKRTLYMARWIKYSANWYGHPSGVNKMAYVHTSSGDVPVLVFSAIGAGSAPLSPYVDLQFTITPGGGSNLAPNLVPNAEIIRGQWNLLELVAVGNTAGNADGSVDWYLNGVHVGSYAVQWQSGATTWGRVHYTTIWGGYNGGAASIPALQWRDDDHLYMSEK